jgi:ribosome-associated translation inhibitor RaiA/cold shock CspA family protein
VLLGCPLPISRCVSAQPRSACQRALVGAIRTMGALCTVECPRGTHHQSAEFVMQEPLQISFHNMESSDALERRVREHWAKLERHYDGIISARIVIEAPHKQPHKSTLGISISIGVPGRDIVVKREQRLHEADNHAAWVINEAFHAAERQLEDYAQKQRRDVKVHEGEREYARIVRLYPDQNYGFIETREQLNIYFHRDVVRDLDFDDLQVGKEVLYTLAPDEGPMGPMASSVWTLGGEHPVR